MTQVINNHNQKYQTENGIMETNNQEDDQRFFNNLIWMI